MKKVAIGALLGAASLLASAGSSSSGVDSPAGGGFVPAEKAQRVLHFTQDRIWYTQDGSVPVCPLSTEVQRCRKNQRSTKQWQDIHSIAIPGHELAGIRYFFAGRDGEANLLLFFGSSSAMVSASKQQAPR